MVVPRIVEASYKLVDAERITLFTISGTGGGGGGGGGGSGGKGNGGGGSGGVSGVMQAVHHYDDVFDDDDGDYNNAIRVNVSLDDEKDELKSLRANVLRLNSSKQNSALKLKAKQTEKGGDTSGENANNGNGGENRHLVCRLSKRGTLDGVTVPWGTGIVGHVALTLKSLNITDAQSDERFNSSIDKKTGFVTRSILTVPIIDSEGKGVAFIQVGSTTLASVNYYLPCFSVGSTTHAAANPFIAALSSFVAL
jgi:hypothetical protein